MLKTRELTRLMDDLAKRREPFVVATVVRIAGSSIGKPGFKAVVSKEGRIVLGTVGGVCPESAIATVAMDVMHSGKARVVKVFLEDANGALEGTLGNKNPDEIHVEAHCGGMMEIYVDPYLPADRLIVIGQGGRDNVEDGLVRFGKMLGYETLVIDHLPVLTEEPDVLITGLDYELDGFSFAPSDSVVVLTHNEEDVKILEVLAQKRVGFVGYMGSSRRAKEKFDELRKRGVAQAFLDSIHTPVGVDIGAVSAEEISVSILADIVATKHGKHLPHKALGGEVAIRIGSQETWN